MQLTRSERIAILDKLLIDTLSQLAPCVTLDLRSGAGGGSGGTLQGTGYDTQASTMEPQSIPAHSANKSGQTEPALLEHTSEETRLTSPTTQIFNNGKVPDDIPPENSDSVIAGQIRRAALAETDPDKQARLWNKYRQYVSLPQKELPSKQ